MLKGKHNKVFRNLKRYIQDVKAILEDLIEKAISEDGIKDINSTGLAENIYTFVETSTLERTSNDLDIKVKVESFNLLIDGLKI